MNKVICFIMGIALTFSCSSEEGRTSEAIEAISSFNLKAHVFELGDDSYEGRGAGYDGELKASNYIARQFEKSELTPIDAEKEIPEGYFQQFSFQSLKSNTPWEVLNTQNVIGIILGEELPDEFIVIGCHHDGQGMKGQSDFGRSIGEVLTDSTSIDDDYIWNSAVDNAVSVSALIEIARVIKGYRLKLKRSLVFVTFSAEESGLNGSNQFIAKPVIQLNKIKAMINLEKIVGDPDSEFIYVSYDNSSIFEEVRIKTDSVANTNLNPFYPGLIPDTDHFPFALNKIPSITIGTGSANNVHTPKDNPAGLDYEMLKKRAEYILQYILEITNSDNTFEFTGDISNFSGAFGGWATVKELEALSIKLDNGFKIITVIPNSNAAKAGLIPGDLIIRIDNQSLTYDDSAFLLEDIIEKAEGNSVPIKIMRKNSVLDLEIFLSD